MFQEVELEIPPLLGNRANAVPRLQVPDYLSAIGASSVIDLFNLLFKAALPDAETNRMLGHTANIQMVISLIDGFADCSPGMRDTILRTGAGILAHIDLHGLCILMLFVDFINVHRDS